MNGCVTPGLDSLEQILSDETRELRAFLGLLEREQQALLGGDAELLILIAGEKNRASASLHCLGLRRTNWLTVHGYGSKRPAIDAWLDTLSATAPSRSAWQTLIDLAAKARARNEENGALIRTHMKHNNQALAVLLAASQQAVLYGRNGHTLTGPGKRHLASA